MGCKFIYFKPKNVIWNIFYTEPLFGRAGIHVSYVSKKLFCWIRLVLVHDVIVLQFRLGCPKLISFSAPDFEHTTLMCCCQKRRKQEAANFQLVC